LRIEISDELYREVAEYVRAHPEKFDTVDDLVEEAVKQYLKMLEERVKAYEYRDREDWF
jgi:hypothetical protein